jgi:ribosomal protein S18 acetylase RimI-like enzyme
VRNENPNSRDPFADLFADEQTSEVEPEPPWTFRALEAEDLPTLAGIDRGTDYRWRHRRFAKESARPYMCGAVAVAGEQVVGYLLYFLLAAYRRQNRLYLRLDVAKIGVAASWRRRGCGTYLFNMARLSLINRFEHGTDSGRFKITMTVPERNLAAQLWAKKNGFTVPQHGVRRDAFDDLDGDGYLFERRDNW